MHSLRMIPVTMMLALALGCGTGHDPLNEFKSMAPRFIPELNKEYADAIATRTEIPRYPEIIGNAEVGLQEVGFVPESVKIDVKNTDSLISPYTGVIVTDGSFQYADLRGRGLGVFTFNFAYQDGKWVPTGGTMTRGRTISGADISGSIQISPSAMQSAMNRIVSGIDAVPAQRQVAKTAHPKRPNTPNKVTKRAPTKPERVKEATPKLDQGTARSLYEQAEEMKELTPEKSLSLLEQAKGLPHDAALGDRINQLSQELHRPDVLYRQAVSCKKSNPDRAKSLLEEALNLQAMDLEPTNDIKQNLRQQILKLLAELEHQRRPGAASVPF